jgi:hypothetical protein
MKPPKVNSPVRYVDLHVLWICLLFTSVTALGFASPYWAIAVVLICQFPLVIRFMSKSLSRHDWVRLWWSEFVVLAVGSVHFLLRTLLNAS